MTDTSGLRSSEACQSIPSYLLRLAQSTWYIWTIAILLFARLLVMPLSSHTFDIVGLSASARRVFEYDLPVLDRWTKGCLILLPYLAQYALYLKVLDWFQIAHNSVLFHLIWKFPLLSSEMLIALVLYETVVLVRRDPILGRLVVLLWLINPFAFWWGAVTGHHAIYTACSLALAFYLAVRKRPLLSTLFLSFASATYYYPVLLFPLFFLYFWNTSAAQGLKGLLKLFVKLGGLFGVSFIVQFSPFLFLESGWYVKQLFIQMVYHAGAAAMSPWEAVVPLPYFSWFRWPYTVITGTTPTAQNAPWLVTLTWRLTFIGPVAAILLLACVMWRYLIIPMVKRQLGEYRFDTFARHSILVLTIALMASGNLHECLFLFLIVLFLVYSFVSRDYRLISVSLVLGCLTYYRLIFHPLVWSNTINASDLIRLFPWSTPPPLLNNFVKALMFLPGLGIAAVQTKGNSKARFASIGIGIGVSGLLILSMTLQAVVIDWHVLSGGVAVRTRLQLAEEERSTRFLIRPSSEQVEMINDRLVRVYLQFKQLSSEGDYEVLRRYVLSSISVKRKFAFFLNLVIPFRYIRGVSIGRCEPTFVSYNSLIVSNNDRHVYAYPASAHYDFSGCADEATSDGYPVILILDKQALARDVASSAQIFIVGKPQDRYLPEKASLVNGFAIGGIGLLLTCVVPYVMILRRLTL